MSGFRVVLDTCVLVPIDQTDLLLTLAQRGIFHREYIKQRAADLVNDF